MGVIDIVTLFAIILFARLGIRLVAKYVAMKKEEKKEREQNGDNLDNQNIQN